ncbi:MAG: threonine synthase [Actinobacteria bacterium]|nr:threonine synthase [Actinomycetota bacterium]MBU4205291.1 threonine synthase [Actinomycetota bacterium]MBU4251296.1 threonine synthase [Actinomycetota bacterium]MBU4365112.1 threonine synthase [Actinomycetota bacterium]MBU4588175.1 threonine synthase [Actinomycetota bacterium]
MRYLSTRGDSAATRPGFGDILLAGLAPDGGLYLPERYPRVDASILAGWRRLLTENGRDANGYAALAASVISEFVGDIPLADLTNLCEKAYSRAAFPDPQVVPVTELSGGIWISHLSGGPTAAFKDLAMQLLGQLFEYQLARTGTELNILGATSGDTGSAAEYAMLGREGVRVFMLTPAGRMTPFQQAQMFSLADPAIINIAVDGVFDDCQDLVKAVNADADFKQRYHLGAVNSINWARLVAQVVYYVASWIRATTADDQRVSFTVPTGNFGNICAGHIAREMGVPIDTLVLATNENNVLDEFFRTGVYRVRSAAETHATSSPSMDISKASNFERFIFDLLGRDGDRVRHLFGELLPTQGYFDLSDTAEFAGLRERYGFVSSSSTHADRVSTIGEVWARDGVLIDPHTADAVKVAAEFVQPGVPMIVTETALPVKFAETIVEAIGSEPAPDPRFAGIENLPRHVIELPNDAEALKSLIRQHVDS